MKPAQATFKGVADANIFYQVWQPDGPARAVIMIAHGVAEHSGRYQQLAEYFAEHGYVVAAVDHEGHGKSDGTPGFIERFDNYAQTLDLLRTRLQADYPELPFILLGHSMGGLIAAYYLLEAQSKFAMCVLSGPAIKSDVEPPGWQAVIIRWLARWLPKLGVLKLDTNAISRDPEVVAAYKKDPLVYDGKLSARQVVEMFDAMHTVERDAHKISLPLLLLHGSEDRLTAPAGSQFLYDNVSSTEKSLKFYPGLYHEIFNEPERLEVFKDVLSWCDSQLGRL